MKKNIELITVALLLGTQTLRGSYFPSFENSAIARALQGIRAFMWGDSHVFEGEIGAAVSGPFVRDPSVSGLFVSEGEIRGNEQDIIDAIMASNIPRVIQFLDADILWYSNLRFSEGRTLPMETMEAARRGVITFEDACRLIEEFGRRYPNMFNDTNRNGENSLDYAIGMGRPDVVEAVLSYKKMRCLLCGNSAKLLVKMAIRFENSGLVQKILKMIEEEQAQELLKLVQEEFNQIKSSRSVSELCVGFLLPKATLKIRGMRTCFELINILSEWMKEKANTKNERELIEAIGMFDVGEVRRLLAIRDLNINYRDRMGCTPIMWAVTTGDLDMVRAVLYRNPDLNVRNDDEETVFDIARKNRNANIIKALDQVWQGRMTW